MQMASYVLFGVLLTILFSHRISGNCTEQFVGDGQENVSLLFNFTWTIGETKRVNCSNGKDQLGECLNVSGIVCPLFLSADIYRISSNIDLTVVNVTILKVNDTMLGNYSCSKSNGASLMVICVTENTASTQTYEVCTSDWTGLCTSVTVVLICFFCYCCVLLWFCKCCPQMNREERNVGLCFSRGFSRGCKRFCCLLTWCMTSVTPFAVLLTLVAAKGWRDVYLYTVLIFIFVFYLGSMILVYNMYLHTRFTCDKVREVLSTCTKTTTNSTDITNDNNGHNTSGTVYQHADNNFRLREHEIRFSPTQNTGTPEPSTAGAPTTVPSAQTRTFYLKHTKPDTRISLPSERVSTPPSPQLRS